MFKYCVSGIGVALVCSTFLSAAATPRTSPPPRPPAPSMTMSASDQRGLLDKYCIACHNERTKAGGLVLEKGRLDVASIPANAAVWEKVVRKLHSGTMPPAGRPRPDKTTVAAFAASVEGTLDQAA